MAANVSKYRHRPHIDADGTAAPLGFAKANAHFWAILAILSFALIFGGGGSKYGLANLIVQLAALIALAFHKEAFVQFWKSSPIVLRLLVGLSIALPLLTIVPLPFGLWSNLPGRELMVQSLDILGDRQWASFSVDPVRTLVAACALVAPLALLAIGWSAPRDRLLSVGWAAVAFGLAHFMVGIPQVLSNGETGLIYPEIAMPGVMFGAFANRNSTGLFFVGVLALAAALPMIPRLVRAEMAVRLSVCLLLTVAIVLTRSRSALVLMLIPLGLLALRLIFARVETLPRGSAPLRSRTGLIAAASLTLVAVIVGGLAFSSPGRVGDVVERFQSTEDARSYIWEDAAYSAKRYWPAGSGVGTFDDVFQVDESLENMTLRRAGRAHNDYLEVAIEAGLLGLALVAAWLAMVLWLSWRARRSPDRWIAWSGSAILLSVALQSITDYPLRNMALLTFSSFALLILVHFGAPRPEVRGQEVLP